MHKVELAITINCHKHKAFKALKEIEHFPNFMKFVKNIKILERHDNKLIAYWQLEIDGAPITWRQEDFIDHDNLEIKFKMVEGDYQHYEGKWQILEIDNNKTKVIVVAHFDWGIPILEAYVKKVLEKKAKLALGGMMKAIKTKLEEEHV